MAQVLVGHLLDLVDIEFCFWTFIIEIISGHCFLNSIAIGCIYCDNLTVTIEAVYIFIFWIVKGLPWKIHAAALHFYFLGLTLNVMLLVIINEMDVQILIVVEHCHSYALVIYKCTGNEGIRKHIKRSSLRIDTYPRIDLEVLLVTKLLRPRILRKDSQPKLSVIYVRNGVLIA